MKTRAAVWTMLAAAGTLIGAAGCTETSCGGVGFSGGVSVDLAAVHQQHPGVLTVKLCIDGNCNSGSLPAAKNIWTGSSDPVKALNIEVTVTDARGKEIFANGLLAKPTKVAVDVPDDEVNRSQQHSGRRHRWRADCYGSYRDRRHRTMTGHSENCPRTR